MPRSGDQARRRLQQAALELYLQHGYDSTTTAEIAGRAGVTERTFFRHFPDKREVLFDGEGALGDDLERGIAEAPEGLDPLTVLLLSFRTAVPLLVRNRPLSERRQAVISATPALRERALMKEASLSTVLAAALQRRGVDAGRAMLAGQIGIAAFSRAVLVWFEHPEHDLDDLLAQTFGDLRTLTTPSA